MPVAAMNAAETFERAICFAARASPTGGALATSGDYRRVRVIQGRRLTHVVDPRSGLPVEQTVTHRFPLSEAEAAFELFRSGDCGKILFVDRDLLPGEVES